MITFKSIAVLDLETTSIPEMDHNTTRITELAVLACEIDHIKRCKQLPRVLHKLVLPFNPLKKIDISATNVTGLSNDLLMNVKPFTKEDAEIFSHFIERLPAPICILSHNGNKFDFPILRRALKNVNMDLLNVIYCADTIEMFRDLLPKAENSLRRNNFRADNETTPKHQKTKPVNSLLYKPKSAKKLFQDDQELFPYDRELSEWVSGQDNSDVFCQKVSARPKSYKLKDVYHFFFGSNFLDSHRAENDSKALLCCVMQCDGFADWLSTNAKTFSSIPPLF